MPKTLGHAARNRTNAVGSAVSAIPLAIGLLAGVAGGTPAVPGGRVSPLAAPTSAGRSRPSAAIKEFSVPMTNLRDWASAVITTVDQVRIEGHSKVHKVADDCEMHFGAHTPAFKGDPDGLVLEPMNACVQAFPGKSEQSDKDWTDFADKVTNATSTLRASGVPRIWPEHLVGGGVSNPDHAVELHPLTTLVSSGKSFDFSENIFAGDYSGGVGEPTALAIVQNTTASVTKNGEAVDISFSGGRIGNFTVLGVVIDRASIESDGAGSFRMNGHVLIDPSTPVPVRIITVKGSAINAGITKLRRGTGTQVELEALVLFSLSPESLLAAAEKSNGRAVAVERPIQLILYGTPGDQ